MSTHVQGHLEHGTPFPASKPDSVTSQGGGRVSKACGRALALLALCTLAGGFLGACHKGSVGGSASNLPQGSLALHPGQAPGAALMFMVEPNSGGHRTNLHVLNVRWGRLADIRDQAGFLRFRDFVVDENVQTDNNYLVEINPVSEKTTVTIKHPFSQDPDSLFVQHVRLLEDGLTQLADKSLSPSELPPFPLVPRNAAIVIQFDDILDPNKITSDTVRVLRGYPPTVPFDSRIIPDPNHGDLADFDGLPGFEYYATRIIIDTTVSALEAAVTNPPLPVNSLGFPASLTQGQPNVVVRIPTLKAPEFGQFFILTNPTNHPLAASGNGSVDFQSPTRDVIRALRSGGNFSVTGDANNGFLVDAIPPSLLGTQAATITNVAAGPLPQTYLCDLDFLLGTCANRLLAGDVLQQGSVFAEIICPPFQNCLPNTEVTGDLVGSIVTSVYFRIIAADPGGPQTIEAGAGTVSMRYHANIPNGKAPCFVRFPNIGLPPDRNVAPDSPMIVRFTEPMDPLSMKPFDSLSIVRRDPALITETNPLTAYDFIVGAISGTTDLREFTFAPVLPFTHDPVTGPPTGEPYYVHIVSGVKGPTDLAGNPLGTSVPPILFRLDPNAAKQETNGFALRFNSNDEIAGIAGVGVQGVGLREFRGQFLLDPDREVMKPRPVSHYQAAADRSQAVPSIMPPFAQGLQTPLSRLGSKMQTLWRYCDVGFGLLDESNTNVDVEGLWWAPVGGAVNSDHYTRFEMSIAHCLRLPDESVDPVNLLPVYPASGIVPQYALNPADPVNDPLKRVYPVTGGPTGYTVDPSELDQGPTGTKFMPWPMNRNVGANLKTYYTWRDTALLNKGGHPSGPGAELAIVATVTQIGAAGQPYPNITVPTIGLPLLMEFRCYPDDSASGLNSFDVNIATNTASTPNFRAFSTGGLGIGQTVPTIVNPDTALVASGGFNPNSTPSPGATTLAVDNTFYIGRMDLVVRVSRAHSIWFDAGLSNSAPSQYAAVVIEPRPQDQPEGTQIVLHYRGATAIVNNVPIQTNALVLDPYGNGPAPLPAFFNGETWKTSLSALNNARFFQVRVTLLSNPQSNLSPELSALGFAYKR